ncbi:uncharacterized protein N7469_008976 [Penicillium citrinum]|uniref:Yeast cell wall synthesis Kre9/Knh1-like N-terminal domain-containing protein n=2 Tax=Penicillium TaxID=5073 RepID=A0A9W9NMG3_PENCI|nr:uncharacterized protein N7469_008976 [Penicillium citrinum]KAJ5222736.1 hypothetical protein N7469_008976 [Penicillium citrinum]KAJ5580898.1 hypothetical protein N7450_007199 [Penicillium hetheringtonii]
MFRFPTLAGPVMFAVSALCLSVVSSQNGSELDLKTKTKVEWLSSHSDPSTFNLYLLNKDKIPSVNLKIASNLTTSDDVYTFDSIDVLPGSGYIFNFKDVSSNSILAQSREFSVVVHGENTTTSSATSTATATAAVTSTGNGTGSSTDAQSGAAARTFGLPMALGAMSIVVGMACELQGVI